MKFGVEVASFASCWVFMPLWICISSDCRSQASTLSRRIRYYEYNLRRVFMTCE